MTRTSSILVSLTLAGVLAACQREAAAPVAAAQGPGDEAAAADAPQAVDAPPPAAPTGPPSGRPSNAPGGVMSGRPPASIAVPPAETPTPDIAAGGRIRYVCEDGSEVDVEYTGTSARLARPDGSMLTLPNAASGTRGGGDVYGGDGGALRRLANVVEIEIEGDAPRVCREVGGTA